MAARAVWVLLPPLLLQRLEFRVVPVRQHNPGGGKQVAGRPGGLWQPLALQPENAPAGGVFRDRQIDRAAERRHANLAAENGLIKPDRQIDGQVGALELEESMRANVTRDQEIPRLVTRHCLALPLQSDLL